jgi:Uri superfamily endonuclease
MSRNLTVGKLGTVRINRGSYVYVGSAFGPGGLTARIGHHARIAPHPHWHIDYLKPVVQLQSVWLSYDRIPREHQWADLLAAMRGAVISVTKFGASDCKCTSHLIYFAKQPSSVSFRRKIHASIKNHDKIFTHSFSKKKL